MHLANENNKLSQHRKISPTALVQVCETTMGRGANRGAVPAVGVMDGPPEAGTRWDGATCSACAPLSFLDVANAKRPYMASADNAVKWLCALFRQI
jgi:hypothetical protein